MDIFEPRWCVKRRAEVFSIRNIVGKNVNCELFLTIPPFPTAWT